MRKCTRCGAYTLSKDKCPRCNGELSVPHPPRFSPEDKYVSLRLRAKISAGILNLDARPSYIP